MEIMKRLVREEEGQGLVEYALIIGVISLLLVAGATAFETQLSALFTRITTKLTGVAP
ncbi:Flp family type IVb pilin [Trichococcus flocculiformis]|uniref:Flp family type IVb pilin n=1 Tax=Trichococcus flocculiformis TaxID=82803 RepID=UPI003DA6A0B6